MGLSSESLSDLERMRIDELLDRDLVRHNDNPFRYLSEPSNLSFSELKSSSLSSSSPDFKFGEQENVNGNKSNKNKLSSIVEIRDSSLHGRGLFLPKIQSHFKAGDIIFHEVPLISQQTLESMQELLLCGNCKGIIGDKIFQLKYASRKVSRQHLTELSKANESEIQTSFTCCKYFCGEIYCSPSCQEQHWEAKGHAYLCTGFEDNENKSFKLNLSGREGKVMPSELSRSSLETLLRFKEFSLETNEIFLLVADAIALVLCRYMEVGIENRKDYALSPFKPFVQERWWDVVQDVSIEETLKELVTDASELLQSFMLERLFLQQRKKKQESSSVSSEDLEEDSDEGEDMKNFILEICSPDYISRLIGMFEQNNVGINALCYERNKPEGDTDETSKLWDILESLYEDCCDTEEEEDGIEEDKGMGLNTLADNMCNRNEGIPFGNDEIDNQIEEEEEEEEMKTEIRSKTEKSKIRDTAMDSGEQHQGKFANLVKEEEEEEEEEKESNAFEDESMGKIILDGTALYSYICCMNHSCDPNVMVIYYPPSYINSSPNCDASKINPKISIDEVRGTRPLMATVIAIKDIHSGDELLHSYIDKYMSREERQEALIDYGFRCQCSKCILEEGLVAVDICN